MNRTARIRADPGGQQRASARAAASATMAIRAGAARLHATAVKPLEERDARTGNDRGEQFDELVVEFGLLYCTRIAAPATPEQKATLEKLSPEAVRENRASRARRSL